MEQMPPLKPHQLAEQLQNAPYEVVEGRVESARLGEFILNASRLHLSGQYEKTEHGHVAINELVRGLVRDDGGVTVGLEIAYNNERGSVTELGNIKYIDEKRTKATANVLKPEGGERPLLPENREWDSIVGVVSRAINQEWERRRGQA